MLEFRQPRNTPEMEKIWQLRYNVYCVEKGFLRQEDYPNGRECDNYDQHSVHFLAIDTDDGEEVLGTLRLIRDSNQGFPIEHHFQLERFVKNREQTVEFSRLIVTREARRLTIPILMGLSKEFYLYSQEYQIEDCYAVLEDPLLRLLRRVGLPFRVVGKRSWYMGAYTTPTFLSVLEAERVLPQNNALFYEFLKEPRGVPVEV